MAHVSDLIATDIDSYLALHEKKELLRSDNDEMQRKCSELKEEKAKFEE